jgi:hypothetical protein
MPWLATGTPHPAHRAQRLDCAQLLADVDEHVEAALVLVLPGRDGGGGGVRQESTAWRQEAPSWSNEGRWRKLGV